TCRARRLPAARACACGGWRAARPTAARRTWRWSSARGARPAGGRSPRYAATAATATSTGTCASPARASCACAGAITRAATSASAGRGGAERGQRVPVDQVGRQRAVAAGGDRVEQQALVLVGDRLPAVAPGALAGPRAVGLD